jgi:hypothetical protein
MNLQVKDELSLRDKVNIIEAEILIHPQLEAPVKHHFSSGLYARELFIPAGSLLTGKIHKYENLNILSSGEMAVLTEDGMQQVKAPFTVVSPPGTKRVAYAFTDCVWTTILATDETDPDVIEAKFTASSEQEFLDFVAQQLIGRD